MDRGAWWAWGRKESDVTEGLSTARGFRKVDNDRYKERENFVT